MSLNNQDIRFSEEKQLNEKLKVIGQKVGETIREDDECPVNVLLKLIIRFLEISNRKGQPDYDELCGQTMIELINKFKNLIQKPVESFPTKLVTGLMTMFQKWGIPLSIFLPEMDTAIEKVTKQCGKNTLPNMLFFNEKA